MGNSVVKRLRPPLEWWTWTPSRLCINKNSRIAHYAMVKQQIIYASPLWIDTCMMCSTQSTCKYKGNLTKSEIISTYLTRQIWGIWKLRPAYSPETPNLGQNRRFFVPCDLEIWWMTLENNRASLLCCFKLCATFHSHWWIQTGVRILKRPIWVKFDDFQSHVTLKFDVWPWKTIGHLYYVTSSSMHPFVAIGEFELELQSGNAHFGSK